MKLPKDIKGRNKIRDAAICLMFEEWHDSELPKTEQLIDIFNRICEKYGITQRRVWQILRENHSYIPINKEYEKVKRIRWLKRQINRRGDKTQKDTADLIDQLRKEIEGDKPLIDNSKHIHTTYNLEGKNDTDVISAINNRLAKRVSV